MPNNLTSNFRALTSSAAFFIACALAFMPAAASAEKADRDKPITIEADKLLHDELKQISVFSGRAVLTKGSMVLRGERIEIRQDPDGYQFGVILPEDKKRAFFRQKREGVDEYLEGEAQRIDYDGRVDRIVLSDQAEIRRYRGTTLGDQMSGKRIVYDNLIDVFTIDGQSGADKNKTPDTRVRATLAPRSKALDAPTDKPAAPLQNNNKK
jgi:lipopolysaccharide export system protein LptA